VPSADATQLVWHRFFERLHYVQEAAEKHRLEVAFETHPQTFKRLTVCISRAFIMDIVKDGLVIDPVIQNEIIARTVAGNFGDQPSQTIHSLGTITTPDGKELRISVLQPAVRHSCRLG
jgi:hypothetical protein